MKLENYLEKNKKQLDTDRPNQDMIWEGVRSGMHQKNSFLKHTLWKVAAIVLLLISSTYIINEETQLFKKKTPLALYGADLGSQELAYQQTIQVKLGEIDQNYAYNNEVISILFEELQLLDTIYKMALDDLQTSGYEEKIVNTIFDTYERRIHVLEKLIMETQKTKNDEKIIYNEI